jgi:hypothetical protein
MVKCFTLQVNANTVTLTLNGKSYANCGASLSQATHMKSSSKRIGKGKNENVF